jgi:hypothetical protein
MKRISYISRAFGLLMFSIVMLTSVFGKQLPQKHHESTKSKQGKSSKQQQQPTNQSFVSELSLEVVVPSHAFDFGDNPFVLPTPQVVYLIIESSAKVYTKPLFRLSYFENLYEHFIAPNAP